MTPYNARPTAAAYAVTEGAEVLRIRAPQSREDLIALDEAAPLMGPPVGSLDEAPPAEA